MSDGVSSCRPNRLVRFEESLDGVCDGLVRRAGPLGDALADYRRSCGIEYRPPTVGTESLVTDFAHGLRDLGRWTGDVGRAFLVADAAEAYKHGIGTIVDEDVNTETDRRVAAYLDEHWEDPYRGVAEGAAAVLAFGLDESDDQDGPPAWIDYLDKGGTAAGIAKELLDGTVKALADLPQSVTITMRIQSRTVIVLSNGVVIDELVRADLEARLRLPAADTAGLAKAARWIGRIGSVAGGAAAFAGQWSDDEGLPTDERILRAGTRAAGGATGGFLGGLGAGALAGTVCGPGAPACSTVLAILGGIGGGIGGGWLSGFLPWMDDTEPLPGERDADELAEVLSGESGELDASLAATVDLVAGDMALRRSEDDPARHERISDLLFDQELLESLAETGEVIPTPSPGPSPSPPTGTTTTTVPVPSGGTTTTAPGVDPDPWVAARPWE